MAGLSLPDGRRTGAPGDPAGRPPLWLWAGEGHLLVQALLQDVLHRAVRGITEGVGPGTGGVQAAGAVLLSQPEDAMDLAQVVEQMVLQEGLHRLLYLFTHLGRLFPAPLRRAPEEGRLVGREVVPVGGALPFRRADMGPEELVAMVGLHQVRGEPHHHLFARVGVWSSIATPAGVEVAVPANLGLEPGGSPERLRRQRPQGLSLQCLEDLQGTLVCGAMDP